MCALVLALAAWCLTTWVRGTWAFVGLLVGLTPTLIYSTTLAAPNGLEMAAGVLLWTALLGLGGRDEIDAALLRRERWLLVAATLSVVLLAGLRTLGPLWGVLILACVMALRGPGNVLAAAARHRGQVVLGSVLAVGTCVAVLLWNRGNIPIAPGAKNGDIDTSWMQVARWPNWILGNIGAFPYRDQPAPLEAYVLVLLVMLTLLVASIRHGAGVGRRAVVLAVVLALAVPSVLVAITLQERGGMWQGRYSLPFTAGIVMLAGLVLDRVRWRSNPPDLRPPALALVMLAVAQIISVVHVQLAELHRRCPRTMPGGCTRRPSAPALLMALAWVVLGAVALSLRPLDAAGPDRGLGPRRGHGRSRSPVTGTRSRCCSPRTPASPDTFRAALESLDAQTRPAREFVIVEDGPLTADHDRVLDRYAASREGVVRVGLAANGSRRRQRGRARGGDRRLDRQDGRGRRTGPEPLRAAARGAAETGADLCGAAMWEFDDDPERPTRLRANPRPTRRSPGGCGSTTRSTIRPPCTGAAGAAGGRLPHDAVHAGLRPLRPAARPGRPDDEPPGAPGRFRRATHVPAPLGPRLPGPGARAPAQPAGPTAWWAGAVPS